MGGKEGKAERSYGCIDGRRRDVGRTSRLVGVEVGGAEEEGRASIAAAGPADGREGIGRKGGKEVVVEVVAMGLCKGGAVGVVGEEGLSAIMVGA